MNRIYFFTALLLCSCWLKGAEFFVSPDGSDNGKGNLKSPFKTIQKGVSKVKAGDTLTILPGTYREAVKWHFDGDPAKKTTVRAKIPGSVLIHGDRAVTGFKAVPNRENCYELPCPQAPQGVNECDTLVMYKQDDTMLNTPYSTYGVWSYDDKAKKLYISTSDGRSPDEHTITLSELPQFGLLISPRTKIKEVRNVVVDGLCVRGFSNRSGGAHSSLWGIAIWNANNCLIKNCTSYLNEGGITMYFADKSRIENCRAYGNGTAKHVSAGNIVVFNSKNSVIDNCLSFKSVTYGIRFYGTNSHNTISNVVSIADSRGSIWIKPDDSTNKLYQCYAPSMVACNRSAHCVYNANDYDKSGQGGPTSLVLGKRHAVNFPEDFADPWNFDLRLQKGSRFKTAFAGTNVFFIAPAGNDANDGRSVKTPWKSLKNVPANATVYLLPGTYPGNLLLAADNVTVAGRGYHAPAVIKGGEYGITIKGSNVHVRNIDFDGQKKSALLIAENKKATLDSCRFTNLTNALSAAENSRITITHCAFDKQTKSIVTGKAQGEFLHNIAPVEPEQLVSCSNVPAKGKNLSYDGLPHGPYYFHYRPSEVRFDHIRIFANSSTKADILWSMSTMPAGTHVQVSPKQGGAGRSFTDFSRDSTLHSVTLSALKPGTEYKCSIAARPRMEYVLSSERLKTAFTPDKLKHKLSRTMTFKTPAADPAPKTLHVSVTGNDLNDGSSNAPFRTISKAAMAAAPGDTVLVGSGTYPESVFVAISGVAAKPVTFKAAPGAEVWLDGSKRRFCRGFLIFGKSDLVFDGFRFKHFGTAHPNSSGIFFAAGSQNIKVSRCFSDARGGGYSPAMLHARNSAKIRLEQNVCIGGMTALTIVECDGIEIVNNVFKKAAIWTLAVFNAPRKTPVLFANNIVTDNVRAKTFQAPLKFTSKDNVTERNNLYFMRFPRELRKIAEFVSPQGTLTQYTLDEYYKAIGKEGKSFFADPEIKVLSTQLCWRNAAERTADLKKPMEFQRNNNNVEDGRNPANFSLYRNWSFSDFFNEKLYRQKKIGLNPDLFRDMAIKAPEGYSKR